MKKFVLKLLVAVCGITTVLFGYLFFVFCFYLLTDGDSGSDQLRVSIGTVIIGAIALVFGKLLFVLLARSRTVLELPRIIDRGND